MISLCVWERTRERESCQTHSCPDLFFSTDRTKAAIAKLMYIYFIFSTMIIKKKGFPVRLTLCKCAWKAPAAVHPFHHLSSPKSCFILFKMIPTVQIRASRLNAGAFHVVKENLVQRLQGEKNSLSKFEVLWTPARYIYFFPGDQTLSWLCGPP